MFNKFSVYKMLYNANIANISGNTEKRNPIQIWYERVENINKAWKAIQEECAIILMDGGFLSKFLKGHRAWRRTTEENSTATETL